LKLKFQTVAEKAAKNFRGLLYFAAHGREMFALKVFAETKLFAFCLLRRSILL